MSSYRVKTGHDQALIDLTVLSPQPNERHAGGIQYTRIGKSADGSIYKQGAWFPFEWDELTASSFSTILGLFGVSSADNANVTVYIRGEDLSTWARYNGVAQRPIPGETVEWEHNPRNIVIRVVNLVAV